MEHKTSRTRGELCCRESSPWCAESTPPLHLANGGGACQHRTRADPRRRRTRGRPMVHGTEKAEYSIAAVSKLTGVSCHALRVWERRSGYPRPHRSGSNQRRYAAEQVHALRRIADLSRSGRPIGELIADLRAGRLEISTPADAGASALPADAAGLVEALCTGDLDAADALLVAHSPRPPRRAGDPGPGAGPGGGRRAVVPGGGLDLPGAPGLDYHPPRLSRGASTTPGGRTCGRPGVRSSPRSRGRGTRGASSS